MTLSIGARLGPYEIVSPLGADGMGEVCRARDTRLDRKVAIKVFPRNRQATPIYAGASNARPDDRERRSTITSDGINVVMGRFELERRVPVGKPMTLAPRRPPQATINPSRRRNPTAQG